MLTRFILALWAIILALIFQPLRKLLAPFEEVAYRAFTGFMVRQGFMLPAVTYSFIDVTCGIVGPGGAFSLGYGAGVAEEGITVAPSEDVNKMDIGADGNGMHSLHADKSGTITVRLLKNSPTNAKLSQLYAFQTASSASHGQNTFNVTNNVSGDSITLTQCAFKKAPDLAYAKDGGIVEWEFHSVRIERLLGAG